MLYQHFDGPERHVTKGDLSSRTQPPFLWRDDLEEFLQDGEDVFFVDDSFDNILFGGAGPLPDAFKDEFRMLRLEIVLRVAFCQFERQ